MGMLMNKKRKKANEARKAALEITDEGKTGPGTPLTPPEGALIKDPVTTPITGDITPDDDQGAGDDEGAGDIEDDDGLKAALESEDDEDLSLDKETVEGLEKEGPIDKGGGKKNKKKK